MIQDKFSPGDSVGRLLSSKIKQISHLFQTCFANVVLNVRIPLNGLNARDKILTAIMLYDSTLLLSAVIGLYANKIS